jgi:hypothetical protein
MHFPLKNGVSSLTRLSQLQIQVAALPFRAFTSTPESQGVNEETAAKRRTEELLQKQRQQNAAVCPFLVNKSGK